MKYLCIVLLAATLVGCQAAATLSNLQAVGPTRSASGDSYGAISGHLKDGTADFDFLIGYKLENLTTTDVKAPAAQPESAVAPSGMSLAQSQGAGSEMAPRAATTAPSPSGVSGGVIRYSGNLLIYIAGHYGQVANEHVITAADGTTFAIVPLGPNRFTVMHYCHVGKQFVTVRSVDGATVKKLETTSYVDVTVDAVNGSVLMTEPQTFLEGGSDLEPQHKLAFEVIESLRKHAGLPCE